MSGEEIFLILFQRPMRWYIRQLGLIVQAAQPIVFHGFLIIWIKIFIIFRYLKKNEKENMVGGLNDRWSNQM